MCSLSFVLSAAEARGSSAAYDGRYRQFTPANIHRETDQRRVVIPRAAVDCHQLRC